MNQHFQIVHYYHSGFSVSAGDLLFVFDYWRGEEGELTEDLQITRETLQPYRTVYVFISHEHIDHLDPVIFTWRDWADVTYIVSSDMPVGTRGRRMAPGDSAVLENGVTVTAFDSTDLGVSFLLDINGFHIFHAGDLNFWHWRDESSVQDIEDAEKEFRKAVEPISRERVDIAFFPVDPRQGSMFDAGANYFILSVKPRLMIPMHYFHRSDVALEYARTASCRSTEVLAMPAYGDTILVDTTDDGFIDISHPITEEETDSGEEYFSEEFSPDDPFIESDLPINLPDDFQAPAGAPAAENARPDSDPASENDLWTTDPGGLSPIPADREAERSSLREETAAYIPEPDREKKSPSTRD